MLANSPHPAHRDDEDHYPTIITGRRARLVTVTPEVWDDPELTPYDIGVYVVAVGLIDDGESGVPVALRERFNDPDAVLLSFMKLLAKGHLRREVTR